MQDDTAAILDKKKGYCSFNAQLVLRCNKIDILIPLNLQMPVS